MRIGQLGCDVQLEVVMIGDDRVSQFDHCAACLLECLLQQDGLQGWVQLLSNVLQETGLAKPHSILQTAEEVFVSELDHIQSIVLLLWGEEMRDVCLLYMYMRNVLHRLAKYYVHVHVYCQAFHMHKHTHSH